MPFKDQLSIEDEIDGEPYGVITHVKTSPADLFSWHVTDPASDVARSTSGYASSQDHAKQNAETALRAFGFNGNVKFVGFHSL